MISLDLCQQHDWFAFGMTLLVLAHHLKLCQFQIEPVERQPLDVGFLASNRYDYCLYTTLCKAEYNNKKYLKFNDSQSNAVPDNLKSWLTHYLKLNFGKKTCYALTTKNTTVSRSKSQLYTEKRWPPGSKVAIDNKDFGWIPTYSTEYGQTSCCCVIF